MPLPAHSQTKPEQLEIARLKREVARLKAERDILKSRRLLANLDNRREVRFRCETPRDLTGGRAEISVSRGLADRVAQSTHPER